MGDIFRPNPRSQKAPQRPPKKCRPILYSSVAAQAATGNTVTRGLASNQDWGCVAPQKSGKAMASDLKPLPALPVAQRTTNPRKPVSEDPIRPISIVYPIHSQGPLQQEPLSGRIFCPDGQHMRVIHRDEKGRYDPETIASVPSLRFLASCTTAELKQPRSRSSSLFGMFPAANTGDSKAVRAVSALSFNRRRNSPTEIMKDVGRKLSASLRKGVDIISMNLKEWDGFIVNRNREVILQTKEPKIWLPNTEFDGNIRPYEVESAMRKHNKSPMYEHLNGEIDFDAPSPNASPEMFRSGHNPVKPEFTTDEFSIACPKMTDYMKHQPRSNSIKSVMSFADRAPPGYMQVCNRCHEEPHRFIHKSTGMCDKCHNQYAQWLYEEQSVNKIGKLEFFWIFQVACLSACVFVCFSFSIDFRLSR